MADRTPACVWAISADLVVALDERLGEPVDSYVNGSQVWFHDPAPDVTIELRLHPVAGFRRPSGVGTHELFEKVALAVATGAPPPAPPAELWDGLEAFPAFGEEIAVDALAAWATELVGRPPDASGLVDHRAVGDEWERTGGRASIVTALFDQLAGGADGQTRF